ncbi:FKBP-type peptidyl-prolyl isomerase-like protein [Balneicella halophila]|uniref:Peptidyl-prolyl cis-trans isomerase n=1 Tax=Balneicella halophila TaxID=1537566 RepID=A0A7L4UMP5_BALHA|nr:FKBP-type peptidyl-prolyl cis-trans isomerase [Balneicella halophila]PVX49896.1 FKBP-type peptidyl-prolyl isomerase-like protein [Balneicella halophila]
MIRKYILYLFAFSSIVFFSASCDDNETYQTRIEDERNDRKRYLNEHGITKEHLLDEGIYYQELYVPTDTTESKKVEAGDHVVVYYTGYFLDGLVFDSNVLYGKFEPMTVHIQDNYNAQIIRQGVAAGSVIRGWPPALLEMHEGTKARIVVPSNMGYGYYGNGNIPGYTTLVFEIEVEEVRKGI